MSAKKAKVAGGEECTEYELAFHLYSLLAKNQESGRNVPSDVAKLVEMRREIAQIASGVPETMADARPLRDLLSELQKWIDDRKTVRNVLPADAMLKIACEKIFRIASGVHEDKNDEEPTIRDNQERARLRSEIGLHAANARHNQPGGYRETRDKVRTMWESGEFKTKTDCAKKAVETFKISLVTAIKHLRNQ